MENTKVQEAIKVLEQLQAQADAQNRAASSSSHGGLGNVVVDLVADSEPSTQIDSDTELLAAGRFADQLNAERDAARRRPIDPLQRSDPWANGPTGSSCKRPHSELPPSAATPHVTHEELRCGLEGLGTRLSQGFTATLARASTELNSMVTESVETSLANMHRQMDARCAAVEVKVETLDATVAATQRDLAAQKILIERLLKDSEDNKSRQSRLEEGQTHLAQQVTQDVEARLVEDPAYNRPPNRAIAKLGTATKTSITAIRATCDTWLNPLFDSPCWEVSGPESGRNWTLSFRATASVAASHVSRAKNALRVSPTVWRKLYANDENAQQTQVFVNPDVPPRVARVQACTKKLLAILQAAHPGRVFESIKAQWHSEYPVQGVITCEGVDICALKADSQYLPPEIFWHPGTEGKGYDKQKVAADLESKLAETSKVHVDTTMWCK